MLEQKLWQDTMDHDRVVEPVSNGGSTYKCKVWWKDGMGLRYGGMTEVPVSLFVVNSNSRVAPIGFVPVVA